MQKVTTGAKVKGTINMEWINREEWRRKIKVYAHEDDTLHIIKITIES